MKLRTLFFSGLALALILSSAAFAHVLEMQFIPQVHNPGMMVIDGKDDDWAWMDPAFAFTSDQMIKSGEEPDFTREDFDVAYFVGWTPPPDNSLYMFARVTDDALDINEDDPNWWWADDSYNLAIDADHSGGSIVGTEIEHIQNGQRWQIRIAPSPGGENSEYGTTGMYHGPSIYQGLAQLAWGHLSPYGAFGSTVEPAGSIHGATDVSYTYEWKMGIWDFYGLSDNESVRHINKPDDVIHFQCSFGDSDIIDERNQGGQQSTLTIGGGHANSDELMDHQFVEDPEAVTAVENATWGRIKSHLDSQMRR